MIIHQCGPDTLIIGGRGKFVQKSSIRSKFDQLPSCFIAPTRSTYSASLIVGGYEMSGLAEQAVQHLGCQ